MDMFYFFIDGKVNVVLDGMILKFGDMWGEEVFIELMLLFLKFVVAEDFVLFGITRKVFAAVI